MADTGADVRVVLPAKRLSLAKSRLRHVLNDAAREALVLAMFSRVVRAAQAARRTAGVGVITSDPIIADQARAHGVRLIRDEAQTLNSALRHAMCDPWLAEAPACVVLTSDLPNLTAEALGALIARIDAPGAMVVASDQHARGTSALGWRGGRFESFRFGARSFVAHQRAARAAGFSVAALLQHPAFFDLDDAESLRGLRAGCPPSPFVYSQREFDAHA